MRNIEPKTSDCMDGPCETEMVKEKEVKKIYPRLRLEHQFFPETKKWEVGKEYTIGMKVKMVGLSIARFQNDSEFEITGFSPDDTDKKPATPKV